MIKISKITFYLLVFSVINFYETSKSIAQETNDASGIEEIIVTARQQAESLQDVPVTVSVMSELDLDRYNISNLVDAAKMVPNFRINAGGSGNGSNIYLRGISVRDLFRLLLINQLLSTLMVLLLIEVDLFTMLTSIWRKSKF